MGNVLFSGLKPRKFVNLNQSIETGIRAPYAAGKPFMTTILDQSGDLSFKELTKLAQLYGFPVFAKAAELSEIMGPDDRKANLFADVRAPYQFPCHTKAATFVSYAFFLEKSAQLSPKVRPLIEERLNKFAKYWGISNAVQQFADRFAELNKEAEYPDSSYALVWLADNGTKARHYPLRNSLEVKAAAEWFGDYIKEVRNEYGFTDRQTIANKILLKAAEFGVRLHSDKVEMLEKHAGKGVCDPKAASKLIRDRVKAAARCTPVMRESMQKLAELVEVRPTVFLDPATMTHLADTIDQFDRTHGLLNKYSELIPAPEDVLFSATYTKSAELCDAACALVTGSVYDKEDFAKLSASSVQDLFGDDIADAVCAGLHIDPVKMAEVAATFPRSDAVIFEQLLEDNGIRPLAKEATTHTGFTPEQLALIAD